MPDAELKPGDLVYHGNHGTARFVGLETIDGSRFYALEFAGGDKLYVPLESRGLLEKVPNDASVRIDRLRKSGPPPPPPRSLIRDRASRSAGGPGLSTPDEETSPLLEAARSASPERKETVARARQHWIDRLIDRSRRNRLLYFYPLKVRTVELTEEQARLALPLIAGDPVPVGRIFGKAELVRGDEEEELFAEIGDVEEADLGVVRRLQEIQKRGDEDLEERGLETVYFAYGMATWKSEDEGRAPEAAVIMVPIRVEGKIGRLSLQPRADLEINLALTHVLEEEFGCDGIAARLEELLAETDELSPDQRASRLFEEISRAAVGVPGFQLNQKAVIANFAFQKLAMVRDLQRWRDHIAGHDIVSAVAGDLGAKRDLSRLKVEVDARTLDKRPPDQEFLVMDADSSQLRAIAGSLQGQSGVFIGPPGTGKSQTIGNLIGELIANGKRVLFVAEKRAALDVVKARLARRGLGDLILDIHGALSRKQVMAQFSTALQTVSGVLPPRVEDLHRDFVAHRERLNEYAERLHRRRQPTGYSAYAAIGHVVALRDQAASSEVRWKGAALKQLTRERVGKVEEALRRAAAEPHLFLRTSRSEWTNAALPDRDSVEAAIELVDELNEQLLPELATITGRCVEQLRLRQPETLTDYQPLMGWLNAANRLFAEYQPDVLRLDLPALAAELAPGGSRSGAFWAVLTNSGYRRAKRQLLLLRKTKVVGAQLLADVVAAVDLKAGWEQVAQPGSLPRPCAEAVGLESARQTVKARLEQLGRYVELPQHTEPIPKLDDVLKHLAADRSTAAKIPAVRGYEREIEGLGAAAYLLEMRARLPVPDRWIPNLRFAWLHSCMDELLLEEPELAVFNGREHDKSVEEFKRLDQERLEVAIDRVKRAYGESVIAAANQHGDQDLLLRRQAALRSRHLPFRELVRRAPAMVTAVKPCWMASPLAVSQLLAGTQQLFDVVIFDEASQVLPEDAVTSILRGKSVVVAGDPNQLPPTQFFAAEREDEGESPADDLPAGFESILDLMISFLPQWSLDWHYRSRDETLIAFSNHYVYEDRLVTFPSAHADEPALTHILVPQLRLGDTEELSSSAEVARVVELILEHAKKRPEMSLGVIAMGIRHANRLDAELARARRTRPELDSFFDSQTDERFFIKNLERVQGDERDVIILSIGYGKDASGKLPYRFGPLLAEGGYRRLNVAVTRAKHQVTLVSSFSHHDMDPARSHRRGIEMLRSYLEYTASGGEVFGDGGPAPIERNEFEIQVQEALERAGLHVIPQFGSSKYRIDLVVQHPEKPGRSLLAIECDGATYHSSLTARDRDRLRQEHLEARGWRFVRVWSTDWFNRRDEELRRVLEVYERELRRDSVTNPSSPAASHAGGGSLSDPTNLASIHPSRGPRPRLTRGLSINDYTRQDLISIACWIRSDGLLRTDDQLVQEMMSELGFERRSRRIEVALRDAVQRSR